MDEMLDFFPNIMDYVFIDHINKFANRLHVQNYLTKKDNSTPNDPVDF